MNKNVCGNIPVKSVRNENTTGARYILLEEEKARFAIEKEDKENEDAGKEKPGVGAI